MNNKILVGLVIAILVVGGVWYFASQNNQTGQLEVTKVKIGNLPFVNGLPLYVAIENGYFKDDGLDIEVVKFEAVNQLSDAIMTGQVDIGSPTSAMAATAIANYKNPGKVKIYSVSGGTIGNSGMSFIIPKNSTLSSLADLRGKKLGINAGAIQMKIIAREILEQNGLDIDKDLTIVELAPSIQIDALASGQVDALLAVEPTPTIAVNKIGAKLWISDAPVKYISDPSWLAAGVINAQFAKENPNTSARVIAIIAKAIEEINKNPNQFRQYLKGYTPLADDIISNIPITSFKVCENITAEDVDSIQRFLDIFTKYKVVDGNMSIDSMLYCN